MPRRNQRDAQAAKTRLREARQALSEYYTDKPDEEYDRRNAAVIKAEKDVPWWRR